MPERFNLLDVVRGFAILGVIWAHTYGDAYKADRVNFDLFGVTIYPFIFDNGWLGVNLFFVVSGFVLFHPRMLGGFDVLDFYKRRVVRLFPLYIIVLVGLYIVHQTPPLEAAWDMVLLLTGVHSFFPSIWIPEVLFVLWSLGIEILFSILLPVIVWLCARFGVVRVTVATVVLCFVYRVAADQVWYAMHPDFGMKTINPLKDNLFGRLDDFLIGMCAAYVLRQGWRPGPRLAAAAVIAGLATGYLFNIVIATPERTVWVSVMSSAGYTMFAASAAILILRFLGDPIVEKPIFLPLTLMGQACFSIYLMHAVFVHELRPLWNFWYLPSALTYLALTIGVSLILFATVEAWGITRKPEWVRRLWEGVGLLRPVDTAKASDSSA